MNKNINNKDKNRFMNKDINTKNDVIETKNNVAELKDNDYFKGIVKILRKAQPGPVILLVSDGTSSVDVVLKETKLEVDDIILLEGKVSERAGKLQIEPRKIEKTEYDFSKILEEKSMPERTKFSITSERYETMKPRFIEIAKRIRLAVLENQPILIRHHNDSDGINSGLAIEQAVKSMMAKQGINPDYNLYRSPSKAPFYEVSDVMKDIVMSKRLDNHGQKKPLILVLDNGSTPEDVFAFKALKALGYESIVIDHHNPVILDLKNQKTSVCPYLSLHLNPYMFGYDSKTSAGMLCYEVARFIDKDFENNLMPAVAAISDRCDVQETEQYIKNANKTREELGKIGVAIDFIAYQMKFDPGKGLFEKVYESPEFVELINEKVKEGIETQLQSTLPYLRTQEIRGVTLSWIDLEKYTLRFTYPTPGKVIGMIHDQVCSKKEGPVLSLGCLSDMIIIRANQPVLPVQQILKTLQEEFPEANVDGGGHEQAGTIKFVPAHFTSILESIKRMLKTREIQEQ